MLSVRTKIIVTVLVVAPFVFVPGMSLGQMGVAGILLFWVWFSRWTD